MELHTPWKEGNSYFYQVVGDTTSSIGNTTSTQLNTTAGGTSNCYVPYYPVVETYYPTYYGWWQTQPNKTEQAFKIVKKLLDKKMVRLETVKDFIELVNSLSEIL